MCSAAWFFSPVGQTVMNRLCTIPTGLGQGIKQGIPKMSQYQGLDNEACKGNKD